MARAGGVLEPLNHRNHSFFSYIECYQPIKITLLLQQGRVYVLTDLVLADDAEGQQGD